MFEKGELVKCVQPISNLCSHFDLSDKEIYEITYSDSDTIRLAGHEFGYDARRFVPANDIKDTGVDFF